MLFVKNMVFLDGAIARLAPDLDILGEIAAISMHFAKKHGERIAAEVGIDPYLPARHVRREGLVRRRPHRRDTHLPRRAGAPRAHPQAPQEPVV